MAHQIFLATPKSADDGTLRGRLEALLKAAPVSAVLIARGERTDAAYRELAATLIPGIQGAGAAALLDNTPDLVRPLKADGVHISGGLKSVRAAVDALKPGFIVGTGDLGSRHEAMLRGELDIDYLMFGDRDDLDGLEMANWWAQTFEIPSVYCAGAGRDPALTTVRTEFVMPGPDVWDDPRALPVLLERAV